MMLQGIDDNECIESPRKVKECRKTGALGIDDEGEGEEKKKKRERKKNREQLQDALGRSEVR